MIRKRSKYAEDQEQESFADSSSGLCEENSQAVINPNVDENSENNIEN